MIDRASWIADEASALVATLPELPPARLIALAAAARELDVAAPVGHALATLAAVIDAYRDGLAPLAGWAIVAAGADTIARVIGGADPAVLAAVRFELETLLPPHTAAASRPAAPDVPAARLIRRT